MKTNNFRRVRVDVPAVAKTDLHCIVCRGVIDRGSTCWESGTQNQAGVVEYFVYLHSACLSLSNASQASKAA